MKSSFKVIILCGVVALSFLTWKQINQHKQLSGRPTLKQQIALLNDFIESQPLNEASFASSTENELQGLDRDFFQLYQSNYAEIVEYLIGRATNPAVKDPEKMLGYYLEQMSRVYYRTDIKTAQFDELLKAELRKPASQRLNSMMEHPIYQQNLVPLWIMREKIRKQIIYVTLNMLMIENADGYDMPPEKSHVANKMLGFLRTTWEQIALDQGTDPQRQKMNRVLRYALQDLFRDTAYAISKYVDDYYGAYTIYPSDNVISFLNLTKQILFKDEAEQKAWEEKIRSDLKDAISNENTSMAAEMTSSWLSLVENELRSSLQESRYDFATPSRTTQAAAAKFCPDANSSRGNIVGNEFPKGTWAITLDDGPNANHSRTILNAFKSSPGSKGTFFWLAQLTSNKNNKPVIDSIKAEGYTLANHSFSHANLPKLSQSQLNKEIIESTTIHTGIYGFRPKFFRCPYGACGPSGGNIRKMIEKENMVHVFWNIDTLDWKDKDADLLFNRTKDQIEMINSKGRGGVILFHDIHQTSAGALQKLIPWMVSQGYKLKSMTEIVQSMNETPCTNWNPENK